MVGFDSILLIFQIREVKVQMQKAVANFMSGYFSTRKRSEKTKSAYETDLRQLRCEFGDATPLLRVNADGLERWAEHLRSNGYAPVSIRRKFATARVFFSYFVRKSALAQSPMWRIRLDLGAHSVTPEFETVRCQETNRRSVAGRGHDIPITTFCA